MKKLSHERFYKQKLLVIIEVSCTKIAHFPKVPAHTGFQVLTIAAAAAAAAAVVAAAVVAVAVAAVVAVVAVIHIHKVIGP